MFRAMNLRNDTPPEVLKRLAKAGYKLAQWMRDLDRIDIAVERYWGCDQDIHLLDAIGLAEWVDSADLRYYRIPRKQWEWSYRKWLSEVKKAVATK